MKKGVLLVLLGAAAIPRGAVFAEDAPASATVQTIEQRLSILERKYEIDKEDAANKAKDASFVTSGNDGFQIKSTDGNSYLRISGLFQADYRDYLADHGSTQLNDQFFLRRVRPTFEGIVNKYIGFRITPDFANGGGTTSGPTSTLLPDAYVDLLYVNGAKARVGKFKPPVGLENLQSDPVMPFVERSLVTNLVPIRDTGVQLSGDFVGGAISYQAAVVNGVADAAYSESDTNDAKDYEGRLFLQPFKQSASEWINGLGFGVAGSVGDQFGNATTSGLTAGYRTEGQQNFFTYQTGAFASGQRKRFSPQGHWYFSHVGLLAEYVASSQEVTRVTTSTATASITNHAWQVTGSYVLTGERRSYGGVKPRKNFDPKTHGWGAFEVVGRYAVFKVDDEAFTKGFASVATSAKKAKSWGAGLNWYVNNNLRLASNYVVTSFDGGAASGNDRPAEKVVLSRVQVTF